MISSFSLIYSFLLFIRRGYYYNLGYYTFKITRYSGTPTKIHIKYTEYKQINKEVYFKLD